MIFLQGGDLSPGDQYMGSIPFALWWGVSLGEGGGGGEMGTAGIDWYISQSVQDGIVAACGFFIMKWCLLKCCMKLWPFCSRSAWGSTSTIWKLMLYWSGERIGIARFCYEGLQILWTFNSQWLPWFRAYKPVTWYEFSILVVLRLSLLLPYKILTSWGPFKSFCHKMLKFVTETCFRVGQNMN